MENFLLNEIEDSFDFDIFECEYEFKNIKLNKNNNYILMNGKIDLLSIKDNLITITDYKTGSNIPSGTDIESLKKLQLPIYQICLQDFLRT